ncbi:PHP14 phosphatase, partial [Nothoprocta ornata]|nr:PHP14 phosphatase [Nothoprocta pentlandii]NWX99122.1 PHP14 phosphatase [Nothoprocta ornata]
GAAAMATVPEVDIDADGTFKYILVRLQRPGGEERRDIVRGTKAAEFHNHIFEKVNPEMEKLGFECKCLGGGKIEHNSKDKKIRVFGLSTGYGKADHSVTVELLKKVYTDYEITWSDDKK